MKNISCILSIKNNYSKLTAAERTVADYILNNSEAVVHMAISKFAENSNSAKSAIIRTCKSLGFSGYSELKISLAGELSKNKQLNYIPYINPNDNTETILNKIFSANVKALHDTAEKVNKKTLDKAVKLLKSADTIYIYAVGTSSGIANDFSYRLMQVGKTSICITDAPTMKITSLNIKPGDVAIGISHSGKTKATIEALQLARENGASTICITSYHNSEITKCSDCPIEIFSDEINYPTEAVSSRIVHLSIIDTLTIALSAADYNTALERSKKTHELINTLRF